MYAETSAKIWSSPISFVATVNYAAPAPCSNRTQQQQLLKATAMYDSFSEMQ